jgi:hypothetical protein
MGSFARSSLLMRFGKKTSLKGVVGGQLLTLLNQSETVQ